MPSSATPPSTRRSRSVRPVSSTWRPRRTWRRLAWSCWPPWPWGWSRRIFSPGRWSARRGRLGGTRLRHGPLRGLLDPAAPTRSSARRDGGAVPGRPPGGGRSAVPWLVAAFRAGAGDGLAHQATVWRVRRPGSRVASARHAGPARARPRAGDARGHRGPCHSVVRPTLDWTPLAVRLAGSVCRRERPPRPAHPGGPAAVPGLVPDPVRRRGGSGIRRGTGRGGSPEALVDARLPDRALSDLRDAAKQESALHLAPVAARGDGGRHRLERLAPCHPDRRGHRSGCGGRSAGECHGIRLASGGPRAGGGYCPGSALAAHARGLAPSRDPRPPGP